MAGRFYDLLVGHRKVVLVLMILTGLLLGSQTPTEFDNSLTIWFLDDDPDVRSYNEFLELFETDEFLAVAIVADDIFQPDVLTDVDRLTTALGGLERVLRATSLTSAESVELVEHENGRTLRTFQLMEEFPDSPEAVEALRARVRGDRLTSQLVADDDTAALIVLDIPHFEDLEEKFILARNVDALCKDMLPDRQVHIAGSAVIDETMARYSQRDMSIFGPLSALVICLVLLALYRSFWATALPMVVIALTMMSTTGIAGIVGVKLNIITTVLVPLGLAVSVAGCVHVISGYRERLQLKLSKEDALRTAFCELALPCVITSVTTAAGLGSLLVTTLAPLRQFGWMGATVVTFALIYTLTLVPIAYSYLPAPKVDKKHETRFMTRLLTYIAKTSWAKPRIIVGLSLVVCAFALAGIPQLRAGADFQRYYHPDDPVLLAAQFVDNRLGGSLSVEVLVEAEDVRTPEIMRGFEEVEAYFDEMEAIGYIMSPAKLVKTLNERYFGDSERYVVPDSLAANAQLLELIIGEQIYRDHFTTDATAGRLSARVVATEYHELVDQREETEQIVAAAFPSARARVTGLGKLIVNLDDYIIVSQIRSVGLAFVIVGLLICIMFRSLRFGFYALIPNATPLLLVIGSMGWLGVTLDVANVMIASILLGLIVDDTVHFLARFKLEEQRAAAAGRPDCLQEALWASGVGTGRALLSTTVILAAAFWTQLFASFRINQTFGLLAGTAVCLALICDLVVLPSVIKLIPLRSGAVADRMRARPSSDSTAEPTTGGQGGAEPV